MSGDVRPTTAPAPSAPVTTAADQDPLVAAGAADRPARRPAPPPVGRSSPAPAQPRIHRQGVAGPRGRHRRRPHPGPHLPGRPAADRPDRHRDPARHRPHPHAVAHRRLQGHRPPRAGLVVHGLGAGADHRPAGLPPLAPPLHVHGGRPPHPDRRRGAHRRLPATEALRRDGPRSLEGLLVPVGPGGRRDHPRHRVPLHARRRRPGPFAGQDRRRRHRGRLLLRPLLPGRRPPE